MPVPLILGGLAAAGGIAKLFGAGAQDKKLTGMVNAAGEYQADGEVKGNLALAKNLFNGRMAGAPLAEQTIIGNQANTQASVERNATDASQVLAMAGTLQGNTNSAVADLAVKEDQSQQQKFGQLQTATQMMNAEKTKVWQDKLRKLNSLMNIKSTKAANTSDAISDITGAAGMAFSGFKGFGGGNGGGGGGLTPELINIIKNSGSFSTPG